MDYTLFLFLNFSVFVVKYRDELGLFFSLGYVQCKEALLTSVSCNLPKFSSGLGRISSRFQLLAHCKTSDRFLVAFGAQIFSHYLE